MWWPTPVIPALKARGWPWVWDQSGPRRQVQSQPALLREIQKRETAHQLTKLGHFWWLSFSNHSQHALSEGLKEQVFLKTPALLGSIQLFSKKLSHEHSHWAVESSCPSHCAASLEPTWKATPGTAPQCTAKGIIFLWWNPKLSSVLWVVLRCWILVFSPSLGILLYMLITKMKARQNVVDITLNIQCQRC